MDASIPRGLRRPLPCIEFKDFLSLPFEKSINSMSSERQIEANRRNAQKSTGPRTVEGKERSRFNALTHGMTAQFDALPGAASRARCRGDRRLDERLKLPNADRCDNLDPVGRPRFGAARSAASSRPTSPA